MGLLDWITDGGGSLFSGDASTPPMPPNIGSGASPDDLNGGVSAMQPGSRPPMPPMQQTGADAAPLPPPPGQGMPQVNQMGDPTGAPNIGSPGAPPPPPLPDPSTQPDPTAGQGQARMPPPPMPQARPAGATPPAPGAIPPPPPEQPPGPPMNIAPTQGAMPPPPAQSGFAPPDMQGRKGILGAFGVDDQSANRMRGALGAGLKAAGNSAGKSPMQALASGAGEGLEGGDKSSDKNNDTTLKYLSAAINAQKAGDTATYNMNYTKYLAAKLKQDTDKVASSGKNDPNSLYLAAGRLTNSDPSLKGYNDAIRAARANGDTAGLAKAQADLDKAKGDIMNGHLGRLGLSPQQAQQAAQQPGMTVGNAIDAGKMGITSKNIAEKLQPGQYYRNPKDGQIYQFNGGPAKGSTPDKPTDPEPRDPNKPERGTRASSDTGSDRGDEGET
ncbi:hypothetical protein ABIB86_000425 [Bradyrhizobium sp. JR1.7]|uniref:hypothetical protein n=1 Tax=unclassified Bradyrhizobium TaxID=2631580 RepID=UPI0033963CDD